METTIVVILFCILIFLVFAVWAITDRLKDIDKGIRGLFPWLEMIKRESENTCIHTKQIGNFVLEIIGRYKSSNIFLENIYNILKKNNDDKKSPDETKKDKEWLEMMEKDFRKAKDKAFKKRVEEIKNMKFDETVSEKMGGLENMIQDENLKYELPKGLPFTKLQNLGINPAIIQHIKNETTDFKTSKTMVDFLQSRLPQTKDNFSFKAMKSLGDAGKFMLVRVPPIGEELPIKVELFIQNGPIKQYGENGMQVHDVLQWTRNMYILLNKKFPCKENRETINHIDIALGWQKERTLRREKEGLEEYDKEIENEPTPTVNEDWKELEKLPDSNPNPTSDSCTGCGNCEDFPDHNPGI